MSEMMNPGYSASITYRLAALLSAAVSLAIASVALFGWVIDAHVLASFRDEYKAMAPNSAVLFMLLGIGLVTCLSQPMAKSTVWIARACGFLTFLAGGFYLLQYALEFDTGLDRFLFTSTHLINNIPEGNVSPVSSAGFFFAGLSLMTMLVRGKYHLALCRMAAILSVGIILFMSVVVLGYLYGTPFLYGGDVIPVALSSSIAFIFLGLSLLMTSGTRVWPMSAFVGPSTGARLLRAFLPITIAIVLWDGWFDGVTVEFFQGNRALVEAVAAILIIAFLAGAITRVSRSIGGSIDRANEERMRAEIAIRASEEKYRSLFEDSRDMIFISDPRGRMLDVNRAGVEMLGYSSRDELIDIDMSQEIYLVKSDRRRLQDNIKERGYVQDFELGLKTKDGDRLDTLVTASAQHDDSGRVVSYRGIIRDVTRQKSLEQQLIEAQKMEAVGLLAGGVAHDFNNLLMVIQGNTKLQLMQVSKEDPVHEALVTINEASERAAALVQQLLAFSRKQILNPAVISVSTLVDGFTKMLSWVMGENIELRFHIEPDTGNVYADRATLEQVLMNLAVNARDAMPQGGVLTVTAGNVRIDEDFRRSHPEATEGDYARITVHDTGTGIDEETMKRMFEPFYSGKERGTGLGLSIVYGIIKQHNGFITVSSSPGEGTTFEIFLPLYGREVSAPSEAPMSGDAVPTGHETILIAEDEDQVRELIRTFLESLGYHVLQARDGQEALDVFLKNIDKIDLVVLDAVMPRLSGPMAYEKMKEVKRDLRSLFVSGYSEEISDRFLREGEETELLRKPVDSGQLGRKVREILQR